jgi:hypothetical protein
MMIGQNGPLSPRSWLSQAKFIKSNNKNEPSAKWEMSNSENSLRNTRI